MERGGGGDSGGRVDLRERDESVTGELCLCVVQVHPSWFTFCLCLDTLANLLTCTSGLLPLPEGFFATLGVG